MEDQRLEALKGAITAAGWQWRSGKDIPYGAQLIVSDGAVEATLDFYPKRGRTVIGGADSSLRRDLAALAADLEQQGAPASAAKPASAAMISGPHIGMDESGKGDWFGPLVVAAVFLDPAGAAALARAGVRDSKELDQASLSRLAARIEATVPATARMVRVVEPDEYNRRYAGLNNINLLLAEIYAEVAVAVHKTTGAEKIVCDQFAQRADRLERTFARAGLPRPTQLHHAESASVAVAAASILATTSFGRELDRLGKQAGLGRPLPAGAFAVRDLRAAARHILAREGAEGLGRYAKLNFKPVQELLGVGLLPENPTNSE